MAERDPDAARAPSLAERYGAAAGLLVLTTAYAALRYHVFQGVPWSQLPLFVLNKAVAWTSVLLLLAAAWRTLRPRPGRAAGRQAGQGAALAGLHVLASLVLQGPASYPGLYAADGRPTLRGGLALLAGVLATSALVGLPRSGLRGAVLPGLLVAHAALLGAPGWVQPSLWPGHLAPISLLSFLAALGLLALRLGALHGARPPGGSPPEQA